MTRLFASLYMGLTVSLIAFIFVAHCINTFWIMDVENLARAQRMHAEIELLDKYAPYMNEREYRAALTRIAQANLVTITPTQTSQIPGYVRQELQRAQVWFDDEDYAYIKTMNPEAYWRVEEDFSHPIIEAEEKIDLAILGALLLIIAIPCTSWILVLHLKLKRLENATLALSRGELNVRAKDGFFWRVGRLNKSFNVMASRLQDLLRSHKSLTHAIAHELRNPLFRLQIQNELLADTLEREEHHTLVDTMAEDLQLMSDMVEELLSYAKMERAELVLNSTSIELAPLIQKLTARIPDTGFKVTLDIPRLRLKADPKLLNRALDNLITNATKYAHQELKIHAQLNAGQVQIRVEDDGPGIADSHKTQVFEPFYRIQSARDRKTGGHGLGLAIVREIAKLHSGKVWVEDAPKGGACFVFSLPYT